jgi:ketosteroid isomerase-like protein
MSGRPRAWRAVLLLALAGLAGCGDSSPRQAIEGVLDARDAALSARDAGAFAATLAGDFAYEPGAPRTEAERVARYFAWWPSFAAQGEDRAVRVQGERAEVLQRLRLAGADEDGTVRLRFTGPERLALAKTGGRWRVTSSRLDLDPILTVLEARRTAMNGRDLEAYLSTIDAAYADGGKTIASIRAAMAANFAKGAAIAVDVLEREIAVADNGATAIQAYTMRVGGSAPAPAKERLTLARNAAGAWRITGGL